MSYTLAEPMTIAVKLNALERAYFFDRCTEEASANNFIGSNTWRAFHSTPKTDNVPSEALRAAFGYLTDRLECFLQQNTNLTRPCFDAFHAEEVEALFEFLRTYRSGVVVEPRARGEFHSFAYNAYCKVVNLAHTHWCFRRRPNCENVQYSPSEHPQLRSCLHVPLDTKVLAGVGAIVDRGDLPPFAIPRGGMGSVRTKHDYMRIQNFFRCEADRIASTNFPGSSVSPLAFEGFW